MKKLQRGTIRFETKDSLPELKLFAADVAAEIRVTHRPVKPVVKAAAKIALHRVRVARSPTRQKNLPNVGLVVAIGILEEEHVARFRDDDPAVHEDERCR